MSGEFVPFSPVDADVPQEGSVRVGDYDINGFRLVANPDYGGHDAPIGWFTDGDDTDVTALFHVARLQFADTGLWPLLLNGLDHASLARPWGDGEFVPQLDWRERVARIDVGVALRQRWDDLVEDFDADESVTAPFATFPGLTRINGPTVDRTAQIPSSRAAHGLALLPAHRPADVVAQIGWEGSVNWGLDGNEIAAVLRSWEDRFSTVIVALGFDTLSIALNRSPATQTEALAMAAEFVAFCPDTVLQGIGTLERLADKLLVEPAWQFWWD
jgi:Domain of unknown function (DUF4253)